MQCAVDVRLSSVLEVVLLLEEEEENIIYTEINTNESMHSEMGPV